MKRIYLALAICLTLISSIVLGQDAANDQTDASRIYGIIPSVTSPDIPPIVFDADAVQHVQIPRVALGHAFEYLGCAGLDMSLSPELAALILANPENRHPRSLRRVLEHPFQFNIDEPKKLGRTIALLTETLGEFAKVTKLGVHVEPISRLSTQRFDVFDQRLQSVVVAERPQTELTAALEATIKADIDSANRNVEKFPVETLDLIRMWLDDRMAPDEVLYYDSRINLIVVKAKPSAVRDFLVLWNLFWKE